MKKLKNLTFACLLIFGLAACSDDDKSDNPPVYDNSETVTSEFTGKIGEETKNTIKFTNPHGTEADLRVYISNQDPSIQIVDSTCDNYGSYEITSKLAAGASCEITYTFKPAKLDTILLKLDIDYTRTFESLCPTTDTVPTYETMMTNNKYVEMYIYNYAEDSNGNKSPAYINVEIPAEYSVNGSNIAGLNIVSYEKDFNLPAKKGDYTFYIYGATLTSNNENCSITDDTYNKTLTVKNDNGCSLKVKANGYVSPIKFTPKEEGNPYYNVNVEINAKYSYNILDENYNKTFEPEYNATNMGENTYFYAGLLKDGEEITSYEITGTYAGKFKVVSTKHNSCNINIADKKISMPNGQKSCFWTVEFADISESGNWTAELKTTLSTGDIKTYNIDGYVSLMTIEEALQNVCKNSTEYKQSSKAYKLF
ncbi:MAG: hypothetical protein K2N11_00045 [Mucispirillum sp.]|nr:hypothetical protein [Mucispirillum sp.]